MKYDKIESEDFMNYMIENNELSLLDIDDGQQVAKIAQERTLMELENKPAFIIYIVPEKTKLKLVDVDSQHIRELIQNPPNQRYLGWNMDGTYTTTYRFNDGIIRKLQNKEKLILLENLYMEFSILIDEHNFYWEQSVEENKINPWLYPYPVIEYPLSFLHLYNALTNNINFEGRLIVSMRYINIRNHSILLYPAGTIGYQKKRSTPFPNDNLTFPELIFDSELTADEITYKMVRYIYNAFGFTQEKIPFYNYELKNFEIDGKDQYR